MNGYEIYDKAIIRLGYKGIGEDTVSETRLMGRVLEILNHLALDLKINTVNNLSDEISATYETIEALCCGMAMFLALGEDDTNKNVIFTALYNAKRAALLSKKAYIEDNLPVTEA